MDWYYWFLVVDNFDVVGVKHRLRGVHRRGEECQHVDVGGIGILLQALVPVGDGPGTVLDRASNKNIHRGDSTLET